LVLVTMHRTVSAVAVLERSIALGMTAALGWELWEYVSFDRHSSEAPMAYGDTIGDLVMGWVGTIAAALLVHFAWRSHMPMHRPATGVDDWIPHVVTPGLPPGNTKSGLSPLSRDPAWSDHGPTS
jgi:hypothetical protein